VGVFLYPQQPADDPGPARHRTGNVINNFNAPVDARGSTFGNGMAGASFTGHGERPAGTLSEAEVSAAISDYVPPPGFRRAAERLRRERVLPIEGADGSGRRTGAIALLREVTDGPIVVLPHAVTARDLERWNFRREYGYAVMDGGERFGEGDPESWWARLSDRVDRAGGYLVVVTTAGLATAGIRWERPPVTSVLRRYLAGNWPAEQVDRLADALASNLPAGYSLNGVTRLVWQLNAGRDLAQPLRRPRKQPGHEVRSWFARHHTSREMAKITALAFLAGTSELTFDSQLRRLEKLLAEYEPLRLREPGSAMDEYAGYRLADQDLMSVERPRTGSVVGFRERGHQQFVISRLRDTCDAWFWDAVHEWINRMVVEDHRVEVASGLAWLACVDLDEVRTSFLEPWSLGRLGWSGQVTAAHVLWCMCREEATASPALRTAVEWARSGDADQRSTAMIAFGGELGVCFPSEAARLHWQLATEAGGGQDAGCAALGRLFGVLVDQTDRADVLLTMLDRRRERFSRPGGDHRIRIVTATAVLAVLTVQSHRTGRPSIVEFLRGRPDQVELVARLWVGVLRTTATRREGLVALWHGTNAFPGGGGAAEPVGRELGETLAEVLHRYERPLLHSDLMRIDCELRANQDGPAPEPWVTFLAALTAADTGRPPHRPEPAS
jgi:hypothetical protein